MKQEKKLDLAIMEIAKTISKYKVHGLVVLGYPDMDHGATIVAGDAKFAGSVLTSVVSNVADRLNEDEKQSFLGGLLMEILDEIAALPDGKGIEMLQDLGRGLDDYCQKVKENEKIHVFKDPKYEN